MLRLDLAGRGVLASVFLAAPSQGCGASSSSSNGGRTTTAAAPASETTAKVVVIFKKKGTYPTSASFPDTPKRG